MRSRQGSDCHVATSPRRDVTKSRRRVNNAEVNNSATSRRHHVATPSQKSASHHLMYERLGIGHREAYGERHGFPEPEDPDFERVLGICTAFHFVRYYLGYYDDVFDTRHFVLFFHDVLDLFLGLHQTLSQTMD